MSYSVSPEQEQMINNFREIVQVDDTELCRTILTQHNWNVDEAVENYLMGSNQISPTGGGDWRSNDENPININPSWVESFIFNPIKWVFQTHQVLINPESDTRRFINDFNQQYGYQHPTFQAVSYQNAVVQAFRQHKLLLIYIHSPLHEDTQSFCENSLCSREVSRYIDDNVLFWAGCVWDTETYSLSLQLQASTYPFLALLHCQSERVVKVLDKIQGDLDERELLDKLNSSINQSSQLVSRQRAEATRRYS
jgi:FAS-associated factor 2